MAPPPSEGSAGKKQQSTFQPDLWDEFFLTYQPPLLAQREQTGEHIASTVQSYMKEHETTREVAIEKLKELIEDSWKDMLTEFLAPTDIPVVVRQMILNLSKASDNMYKYTDAFTTSETIKDMITKLFVEPVE